MPIRLHSFGARIANKRLEPTRLAPPVYSYVTRRAAQAQRSAGGATAKAHQPQWGDMFIARPNRNLRKPRRGGMVLSRTGHAAPTGLAEKIGGVVVTINMSLLRSWPNPAHALDGWIPSLLIAGHHWPAASDEHR